MPRYPADNGVRGFRNGPRLVITQEPCLMPLNRVALEEELEHQREDIMKISSDNYHLAQNRMILQRELSVVKDEIHNLGQVVPKLRAGKESQARELIQKGLKLESEIRATEPLKAEVMQLRAEAERLNVLQEDLLSRINGLKQDLSRLHAEKQQENLMRADIDVLLQELKKAREAFEYEKKANAELLEQKQAMEINLVSMARDIEKMRAEHLSRGGGYGMLRGSNELEYPGDVPGGGYGVASGSYNMLRPNYH